MPLHSPAPGPRDDAHPRAARPWARAWARLTAKRRGPAAGLVVLLLGLLLTGGGYALLAPANASSSSASDTALVAKGRQLFLVGCATCHGEHGQGNLTTSGNNYGPALVGVGAAAVDFQVGTGRMPMAQPGPQAPEKEPVYDDAEIRALAAYVASLGPGPAVPDKANYDTSDATNEDVVRGGQFFLTNCTACHNFAGAGGALPSGRHAPKLNGVTNKHIYEALITGPQQMPVFSDGVLKPQEKRDIIAYLNHIHSSPSAGGSDLGSLGPVSEGMYAWIVGIGSLVGFTVWIAAHSTRSKKSKVHT